MSRRERLPIDEVFARVNAQPIPDADALAQMSLVEIEQQLAEMGVDTEHELDALLGEVGSPPIGALADLSTSDLEQLSLAQVERRLEAEGVDLPVWLSRAESLIRAARMRQPPNDAPAQSARGLAGGTRGGQDRPALPVPGGRYRRRVPQALAASIVIVAVASVTFSLLHDPALEVGAPRLDEEGVITSPVTVAAPAMHEKLRKHEDAQSQGLAAGKRGGAEPGPAPATGEALAESRHENAGSVEQAPLASAADRRPALAMPAPAAAIREDEASAVTRKRVPRAIVRAPAPPAAQRENDRARTNSAGGPTGLVRAEPQARARKALEDNAGVAAQRQQPMTSATASVADDAPMAVHTLRADETLAALLAGLHLRANDEHALLRLLADVEAVPGAVLRLRLRDGFVHAAALQSPNGQSVSVIRDAQGALVLER